VALVETLPELETDPKLTQSRGDLSTALHLPGYVYHSPEIFEIEQEKIFMKDWLAMGRVEEFEKAGDYRTFRVMGEPVIICRDGNGTLNAFANVCAHRGVEVASGEGNLDEFSCPYHGWLYDLQGKLIGAPYMKEAEGFDPANCRLKPLRLGTWAGWVFINFDEHAESFESSIAWFDDAFGMFRMEDCRFSGKYVTELDCNWKFVNENLMDVYHFQTLHVATFGAHLDGEKFKIGLTDKGDVNAFYKAAPTVPEGKTLVGKMPWFGDDIGEDLGCMGHFAPQFHVFGRCDHISPLIVEPLGVDRTRMTLYHLFPKDLFDKPDFAEKAQVYYDFWIQILEEDRTMVQGMQRNMRTEQFLPGPMSKLEKTVQNIINGYLDRVQA
jgi:choline monooxygenase